MARFGAPLVTLSFLTVGVQTVLNAAAGGLRMPLRRYTPAAIVVYFVYVFVLPPIFGVARLFLDWFDKIAPWFDFSTNQNVLMDWDLSSKDWAHLAVSSIWWLWLPLMATSRRRPPCSPLSR